MKGVSEGSGIELEKKDETLGERIENVGVGTPVVVEKAPVKKKVRVVKKIVKKKVLKKVPKRLLVAKPNCNDLEKVVSDKVNDNVHMEIESSVPVEIDKIPNVVDVEVSDKEKCVRLVEIGDCCRGESEMNGLVTAASLLCDQKQIEFQDSDLNGIEWQETDQKQIEMHDSDQSRIGLQDSDQSQIGLQGSDQSRIGLQGSDQSRIELQDGDQSQIGLQDGDQSQIGLQDSDQRRIGLQDGDQSRIGLQDSDQNQIKLEVNDQNGIELQETYQNGMELQHSDHNQIELQDREHDINTMDVEEHEGKEGANEQDENSSKMDVGVSEGTNVEESVKELIANSETDSLKSPEVLSEKKVLSGEMVASWWHMKQRTKIFIHGLNKDTNEEAIKKVFEKLGEVVEVKIITNFKTGKNRGFGFIRYASAELADLALTKYRHVEICGSTCHTAAVEGNDTILLNNIDKKWNNENVLSLLHKIGIMNIDEVSVVPDLVNTELNRGFAFLEFQTMRDAQIAYSKLQNTNVFGEHSNIKAAWAESLADPVEEEMHNVKSVYAEHIPSSWNEKEVQDHFKIFGEIESIALAKNLRSTKRNDFAFINFKTCAAALSCIEALTHKKSTNYNDIKAHPKVSLAKSIPKGRPTKTISESTVTEVSKFNHNTHQSRPIQSRYQNTTQPRPFQPFLDVYKPQKPNNVKMSSIGNRHGGSSTTDELVKILREQASWKQGGPSSAAGMSTGHHQPPFRGKQLLTEQGSKSLYHDPRAYHQNHIQIPNTTHLRPRVTSSLPHYDQHRAHYTSGSFNVNEANPRYFQTRDQATYPGSNSLYRKMR